MSGGRGPEVAVRRLEFTAMAVSLPAEVWHLTVPSPQVGKTLWPEIHKEHIHHQPSSNGLV